MQTPCHWQLSDPPDFTCPAIKNTNIADGWISKWHQHAICSAVWWRRHRRLQTPYSATQHSDFTDLLFTFQTSCSSMVRVWMRCHWCRNKCATCRETGARTAAALRARVLQRTSPKPDNRCGKYDRKYASQCARLSANRTTQRKYALVCHTEFHPNRSRNMESTSTNSFTSVIKALLSMDPIFTEVTFGRRISVKRITIMNFVKIPQQLLLLPLGHKWTDGRVPT
jgi:hypothetical protein